MKKAFKLTVVTLLSCFSLSSQVNFDSLSHIDYVSLHDSYLNDVWGHVDQFGNEYALVGGRKGTSVVSLSNPLQANELFWQPGDESVWRDINTWQNYAYVTTEALSGLMILDLNSLPDASGISTSYYTGPTDNPWQSAHTLFIDSSGYAYIFGANRGEGGVIILDIHTDPLNPVEVGVFDTWYCHDGYVQNDTMYLAHIAEGFISIVDVSDRANPVLLGTKNTSFNFSHNIWTTPNGKIAFTTDEVSGAFVGAYDISDPGNITLLDEVQNSPGKGVIPHNVHVQDDFLITSYYSDGVVIFDASRPHNLVQVAHYDTYPGQTTSYDGCWASYPFLPSGLVLAADITQGLFVLNPHYHRACFLEGTVSDQNTGNPLNKVKITIENDDQTEFSKSDGSYATGIVQSGQTLVTFFKVGYYTKTISVNLAENLVTNLFVQLIPIPSFNLKVKVKDFASNQAIIDAKISLESSLTVDELTSNGLGEATFTLYYEENYELVAGKWGYQNQCETTLLNAQTGEITVYLHTGIYDDFTFDFGWTATFSGATSGFWERGVPIGTWTGSGPSVDSENDCGKKAFVTGNSSNMHPANDDVKDGLVTLYSPIFDLSTFPSPYLHYDRWFYNFHGYYPFNDTLKIYISNGDSTVLLDQQGSDTNTFFRWNAKSFHIPDYIQPSSGMQLIVKVSDQALEDNITEAGIDNFFVDSIDQYALKIPGTDELVIFPNPVQNTLTIMHAPIFSTWILTDLNGKVIQEQQVEDELLIFRLEHFAPGYYLLHSGDRVFKVIKN